MPRSTFFLWSEWKQLFEGLDKFDFLCSFAIFISLTLLNAKWQFQPKSLPEMYIQFQVSYETLNSLPFQCPSSFLT